MGETYVEMEEDTYNPNILDTIKWSMVSHPEGWDKMTYHQMRQHFKCSAHGNDQTKPLPTLDEWNTLRQNYKDVVDPHSTFDEAVPPTEGYNYDGLGNPPPYYPKHSKGKGRGLFANRFIKKGELVDDGNKHAVIFPNATSFRKYTFSLPRKLACDIVEWPWTQILHKGGPLKIVVTLDIAILCNSGSSTETTNVMPIENATKGEYTSLKFFATRDVEKDEELLMDYSIYRVSIIKCFIHLYIMCFGTKSNYNLYCRHHGKRLVYKMISNSFGEVHSIRFMSALCVHTYTLFWKNACLESWINLE